MRQACDLFGGIGSLVRGKTVAVKVNLTGWPFQWIGGRPPGETYVTHGDTALALAQVLSENGARRIRFVESQGVALPLEDVAAAAGWDVRALQAISGVEFENTRNLGYGTQYARLTVPGGGRLFSHFDVNHSYADADVLVSLCKMKEHATAAGIDGLGDTDRKLLKTIILNYKGGPVGIEAIASTLQIETDVLLDVIEPYLLKSGFVIRTSQGRKATDQAYTHLNISHHKEPNLFDNSKTKRRL